MKKIAKRNRKYNKLIGKVCVKVGNPKCSDCKMTGDCKKLELVDGKYICLSSKVPCAGSQKLSWWKRFKHKFFML